MHRPEVSASKSLLVTSPSFDSGANLPRRFTADGKGQSPALNWSGAPAETASVVLLVEDADSPSREPLVHAIAWLPGSSEGVIPEGALNPSDDAALKTLGRNSYLMSRYMPPDPPPGHGIHRYAFQVFALDKTLNFERAPGRRALLRAMAGHVLAVGHVLVTYERS